MAKKRNATINPKINDKNYFQYDIMVALNHQIIKYNPKRLKKQMFYRLTQLEKCKLSMT